MHHDDEDLDGSGCSDALKGEQVSSFARLMTIRDIYEALIERRSCRASMPPNDALDIMTSMAGQPDAGLLRAFHDVV